MNRMSTARLSRIQSGPNSTAKRHNAQRMKSGFTATEVVISTTITAATIMAIFSAFFWCAERSATCTKMAWSQREAMETSMQLTDYIRNAVKISDIDKKEGTWLELTFPDGEVGTLIYSNAVPLQRDGRLYLTRSDSTDSTNELLVARGLSELLDSKGHTIPVFKSQPNGNAVEISYRVSEPTAGGYRAVDDLNFAVSMRFSAALRNGLLPKKTPPEKPVTRVPITARF